MTTEEQLRNLEVQWNLERDARLTAEAALDRIKKAADISFRGPSHSNAWHLRQAAARLDRGYQAGGSNSCAAIARILREVATLLSDESGAPSGGTP